MPEPVQTPDVSAALAQEFQLKGRLPMMLDEIIVPVAIVRDLSGEDAFTAGRPVNEARSWRRARRGIWLDIATSRYVVFVSPQRAARITRLEWTTQAATAGKRLAVVRGDLRQPGGLTDGAGSGSTAVNAGRFTDDLAGAPVTSFGSPPTATAGLIVHTANATTDFDIPAVALIASQSEVGTSRELTLDVPAGGAVSLVPVNAPNFAHPNYDRLRFEGAAGKVEMVVEWLEAW